LKKLVQSFAPHTVLILLILFVGSRLSVLDFSSLPDTKQQNIGFRLVYWLLHDGFHFGKAGMIVLSVLMVFGQAVYTNNIAVRHRLFARPSYFTAFSFLLVTAFHPSMVQFSPALLANWTLLIAFDLMLGFNSAAQPRKMMFNAGFSLALGSLFFGPVISFILLFLIALLLLRSFNMQEWVVSLMGYLTPLYFAVSLLFLFDGLEHFYSLSSILPKLPDMSVNTRWYYTKPALITFLLASGAFALEKQLHKTTINVRRAWLVIFFYGMLAFLLTAVLAMSPSAWIFCCAPAGLLLAYGYQHEKPVFLSNFTFYLSLLVLLASQFLIFYEIWYSRIPRV
jgi:hypothetical protein